MVRRLFKLLRRKLGTNELRHAHEAAHGLILEHPSVRNLRRASTRRLLRLLRNTRAHRVEVVWVRWWRHWSVGGLARWSSSGDSWGLHQRCDMLVFLQFELALLYLLLLLLL